jgi:hypothetical protein
MHVAQHQAVKVAVPAALLSHAMSAADMARHLRRSSGSSALCFALAMYENVAWANEGWAAFWADVISEV